MSGLNGFEDQVLDIVHHLIVQDEKRVKREICVRVEDRVHFTSASKPF